MDERNITLTISNIQRSLENEYVKNANANDVYLPGTYLFRKRFIFLTNFVSENISHIDTFDQTQRKSRILI